MSPCIAFPGWAFLAGSTGLVLTVYGFKASFHIYPVFLFPRWNTSSVPSYHFQSLCYDLLWTLPYCHYCFSFLKNFFFLFWLWIILKIFIGFVTRWLLFCILFFWREAWGILAPEPGIKLAPSTLEGKVLSIGPPGKSTVAFQIRPPHIQAFWPAQDRVGLFIPVLLNRENTSAILFEKEWRDPRYRP